MDCKKVVELLWENQLSPETEEHLKTCENCQRDRELIEKVKSSLSAPDNIVEETMKKIKKEKRRHAILTFSKVAASLVVIAALAFFAKSYITSNTKAENDGAMREDASSVGTTNKNETYNSYVTDMEIEEPTVEAEEDVLQDITTPSQTVDYNDLYIRLFSYKDSLLLTSKSCDFVVDASESEVLKALEPYSPQLIDGYILLDSDFTHEVTEALTNAGIEILVTTSSESVLKTFIFFANNI